MSHARTTAVKSAALTLLALLLSVVGLSGPMTSTAQAAPTGQVATAGKALAASQGLSTARRYPTYCRTKNKKNYQKTTCIHLTKIYKRKFNVVYRDGVRNSHKGAATLTCVAESSKTITFSVSLSVKTEAGAIFAKVGAEVTGGISHSVTSRYGASISKRVPGKRTMFCDRGIYTYSFKGTVTTVVCTNANCSTGTKKFKGKAPQRNLWHIYYGH